MANVHNSQFDPEIHLKKKGGLKKTHYTLCLDGGDDVIRLEIDFEPITRLMSGLLAWTPSTAITFLSDSVGGSETEIINYIRIVIIFMTISSVAQFCWLLFIYFST